MNVRPVWEETIRALEHLCTTFNIDKQCAVGEWNIFVSFLAKRSESSLNQVLKALITQDIGDAFRPTVLILVAGVTP